MTKGCSLQTITECPSGHAVCRTRTDLKEGKCSDCKQPFVGGVKISCKCDDPECRFHISAKYCTVCVDKPKMVHLITKVKICAIPGKTCTICDRMCNHKGHKIANMCKVCGVSFCRPCVVSARPKAKSKDGKRKVLKAKPSCPKPVKSLTTPAAETSAPVSDIQKLLEMAGLTPEPTPRARPSNLVVDVILADTEQPVTSKSRSDSSSSGFSGVCLNRQKSKMAVMSPLPKIVPRKSKDAALRPHSVDTIEFEEELSSNESDLSSVSSFEEEAGALAKSEAASSSDFEM